MVSEGLWDETILKLVEMLDEAANDSGDIR